MKEVNNLKISGSLWKGNAKVEMSLTFARSSKKADVAKAMSG